MDCETGVLEWVTEYEHERQCVHVMCVWDSVPECEC
jgi:hypothetical protein